MRALSSVLVTGGAGFIGSHLVRRLIADRPQVRVVTLDALTYAGHLSNLDGLADRSRHTFVHGDVCDTELVRRTLTTHAVDTVLHLAAESHVDRSIDAPLTFVRTNVEGTASMLLAATQAWADRPPGAPPARFHHVSTDEVYGDLAPGAPPAREGDLYAPSSPYAASKASADHLVHAWRRTYGLPVSITHATNTWGTHQLAEKFLPVVITQALRGRPVPIYGDGRQVRDWLHVDDHVDALIAAVERGPEGGVWHVSAEVQVENRALAERVCGLLDDLRPAGAPHARWLTTVRDRPGHDRRYALDATRARQELGWAPTRTLDTALADVVAWYVAHGGCA